MHCIAFHAEFWVLDSLGLLCSYCRIDALFGVCLLELTLDDSLYSYLDLILGAYFTCCCLGCGLLCWALCWLAGFRVQTCDLRCFGLDCVYRMFGLVILRWSGCLG